MAASKNRVVRRSRGESASEGETKPPTENLGEGNAYVPEMEVYTSYVGRRVNKVQDMAMFEYALQNDVNVLLAGPTGSGKTRVGAAFAAYLGIPYYSVPCDVSIDPSALFGKMMPTDTVGKFQWQDGPVTELVRSGGVLNISEVNFMPPKISASLFPLLDHRRQLPLLGNDGEIIRPESGKLLIIADHNPGYRGTQQLNAAFQNRFPLKVEWGYDDDVEASLVTSPNLLALAGELRAMAGREIRTPVATNMLMEFERFALQFGIDFAVGNFVNSFELTERDAVRNLINLRKGSLHKEIILPSTPVSASKIEDGKEDAGDCQDCGLSKSECECGLEFTF